MSSLKKLPKNGGRLACSWRGYCEMTATALTSNTRGHRPACALENQRLRRRQFMDSSNGGRCSIDPSSSAQSQRCLRWRSRRLGMGYFYLFWRWVLTNFEKTAPKFEKAGKTRSQESEPRLLPWARVRPAADRRARIPARHSPLHHADRDRSFGRHGAEEPAIGCRHDARRRRLSWLSFSPVRVLPPCAPQNNDVCQQRPHA